MTASIPHAFDKTSDGLHKPLLCGGVETFTAHALCGESPEQFICRTEAQARLRGLEIFHAVLWGDPALSQRVRKRLWPLSFLGRHDTPKGSFLGGRFEALPQGSFSWVCNDKGIVQGVRWQDASAYYLWCGAILPSDVNASPGAQSAEVWQQFSSLLSACQMTPRQIVRTWFYNDHILDWYDDFNMVRTAFFKQHDIFGHFVPASTGIGAANPEGSALCAGFLAITGRPHGGFGVKMAPSPLQCPAYDYRSAFSRAALCEFPEGRTLFVSGTASIEPGGKSVHLGDLDKQIDLTLCVMGAILEASHFAWSDVARAIAYFPKMEWMEAFARRIQAEGIPPFPYVYAHADVCRGDLMFELELDAVRTA